MSFRLANIRFDYAESDELHPIGPRDIVMVGIRTMDVTCPEGHRWRATEGVRGGIHHQAGGFWVECPTCGRQQTYVFQGETIVPVPD